MCKDYTDTADTVGILCKKDNYLTTHVKMSSPTFTLNKLQAKTKETIGNVADADGNLTKDQNRRIKYVLPMSLLQGA